MTAAERATDAARTGAAEHRAQTDGDLSRSQQRRIAAQDAAQTGQQPAEGDRVDVTYRDCTVRRVSTGALGRTWVTAEAPSAVVLDFELGEDTIEVRPSGDRAVVAAEPEPGVLGLPSGWYRTTPASTALSVGDCVGLSVRRQGVDLEADDILSPAKARTLAARLVEAAGIVEQLRAGAR